jgi:hypothetical protein
MNWEEKTEIFGENLPIVILNTTDPMWTDLELNLVLRGEKLGINRLQNGVELTWVCSELEVVLKF